MLDALFGTSMPTAFLPGIGARMRMLWASSAMAMFPWMPVIFSTLTPGSSAISNCVTRGPTVMSEMIPPTWKLFSVSSSLSVALWM